VTDSSEERVVTTMPVHGPYRDQFAKSPQLRFRALLGVNVHFARATAT
jgi:hypothetical protein